MALQCAISFSLHLPSSRHRIPGSSPSQFPPPRHRIPGLQISLKEQRKHSKRICIGCQVNPEAGTESLGIVKERSVSVVLLAGGKGKRMGVGMPKQYIPLLGQPIALYSFYTFSRLSEVKEIVVVCDPSYKDVFEDASKEIQVKLKFAIPGKERQDSVFNCFQEIDGSSELVCIHDSARPLVSSRDTEKVPKVLPCYPAVPVLRDAQLNGAAVLGVPVKATIKEVIKPELLRDGFELVKRNNLEVTDDVSIVEHLKHPVYITEGSYTNIKVTTPDDLLLAEHILNMDIAVPA